MSDVSIHQFLVLYTWFPLAALLLFMLLIARTYCKFSGVRTFFWWFILPIVLYGIVLVRYAGVGIVLGDLFADVVGVLASGSLIFLSILLYRIMMVKHDDA